MTKCGNSANISDRELRKERTQTPALDVVRALLKSGEVPIGFLAKRLYLQTSQIRSILTELEEKDVIQITGETVSLATDET